MTNLDGFEDVSHLASPLTLGARVLPNFRARSHQKIISDAIVDAVTQRGPRFICVSVPQQFGKSTITSILTPALWLEWHALGIVPGGLVGLMSYEDSLAMSWSIKVRRLIEANPDTFVSTLRKDSKAAGYWETAQGGGIIAIGTAGSIQGRPISLLGIDDPTKNFDQAMSANHQEKLWDLWTSVLYGRLQPWTVVLVTMARWAPDDFIGRLMSPDYEGDPSRWRYIRIPYLSEGEGDALLRPEGEPLLRPQAEYTLDQARAEALEVKDSSSTYSWNSLWQQNPLDEEGAIFPESHWRYWGGDSQYALPSNFDTVIFSWDMAFKDEDYHDWVVGQCWGVLGADRYLIDQVRGHWGFTETCQRVDNFTKRIRDQYPKARLILVEDKANGTAVINVMRSKIGGLWPVTPEESKLSRAWSCEPLQRGGNLYIPAQSVYPWVREFVNECAAFRGGDSGHDDQVDSMTQALNHLMHYQHEPVTFRAPPTIELTRAPARAGSRIFQPGPNIPIPLPFRRTP